MSTHEFNTRSLAAFPILDPSPDLKAISQKCIALWDKNSVHKFNPESGKKIFSVDTPPPYVSASHLHVGHAMSYTQAEIIVRYQRMLGKEVFYPMGFDDNGLPTERHVELVHNITDKTQISRSEFRKLCVEVTKEGAETYKELWRSLGISVDWNLRYSTIDERSQRASQLSFIDLFRKGLIYRQEQPILWDTKFQTALAQADLDTIERTGKMYHIDFSSEENPLIISTTRPELIPACVGLFYHPNDERYAYLTGKEATIPLSGHNVPILASDHVKPEFGTGLMMVCTFGDSEDVEKWKEHNLATRIIISPDGKMNALAGAYAGLPVVEARPKILKDLEALGLVKGSTTVKQAVSVGERSEQPVEFHMAPQWFINVLDHKEKFLERADELNWHPDYMKTRLVNWVNGLKYDWNVSRQRYYGVPFPVWYVVDDKGLIIDTVLADEKDLPIDPIETSPPQWAIDKYPGKAFKPEMDVMDTWMTSSVSPFINANWRSLDQDISAEGIYPMDLRVQAHEIIRTWLFYTMVKSDFHADTLPWKDAMISGWGVNEQGKKISKRSLEQETDAAGFNRFNPEHLIETYGADAIRYWAASAKLGQDLKFSEKEVRRGKSVANKIWNASRMAFNYMDGFDYSAEKIAYEDRTIEDQWIISELNKTIAEMTVHLDQFDYSTARTALDKFFFTSYCDNYLELIKPRFQDGTEWSVKEVKSTQTTMHECTRTILGLFAPYLPFITEELYQRGNKFGGTEVSLHQSSWPTHMPTLSFDRKDEMDMILWATGEARKSRSSLHLTMAQTLQQATLITNNDKWVAMIAEHGKSIRSALRSENVHIELGENPAITYKLPPAEREAQLGAKPDVT